MRCLSLSAFRFGITAVCLGASLIVPLCRSQAAPRAQTQSRQLVEVEAGRSVEVKDVYATSHALLIGVNHYPHVPASLQLQYAVKDVEDVKQVLIAHYGFAPEHVTTLTDAEATLANIRNALADLSSKKRVKPNDRVLVFFSGHGQTVPLGDGSDMGFLIPADADIDLNDPTDASGYLKTCLQMSEVWNYLDSSPAKHVLFLADACYSGLLAEQKGGGGLNAASLPVWAGRRARQVITAGGKGETSEENSKLGHGAFTYQLLDELNARAQEPGKVFATSDLFGALATAVSNQTGGKQTPQTRKYKVEGEFLFITAGKAKPGPHKKVKDEDGTGVNAQGFKTKKNPRDGAEMILIPEGEFVMGCEEFYVERPQRKVSLDSFWVYKNLVTVAQYEKFCKETIRDMPPEPEGGWKDDHPIVNVTWNDANAYCRWAHGYLPTEAQWEKAARGTDGRKYPWGEEWDGSKLNLNTTTTVPVGSFPQGASPYGVMDMAGDVWQWCADWYDKNYYQLQVNNNPQGPETGAARVVRGSFWDHTSPLNFRAALRGWWSPNGRLNKGGFRCVQNGS